MPDLLRILATWRLANLLHDQGEQGPFEILGRFRSWAGVRYDEYSEPYGVTEAGKALSCFYCTSVWVGLVIGRGNPVKALAYSAGAILVRAILRKLS